MAIVDLDALERKGSSGCGVLDRAAVVRRIAELETELFGRGAWSENMVREELAAPARTYLLDVVAPEDPSTSLCSVQDDTSSCHPERRAKPGAEGSWPIIRGYAGYWYDGDDAELMTIGVAKPYQRHGIAAALLGALVDRARSQGARRMLLEVRVDNEPALALYQRFGFERMGLRKRYYQPGNIDAYTMSLDLNPRIVGFSAPGVAGVIQGDWAKPEPDSQGASDGPDTANETDMTRDTREQGAEQ